MPSYALLNTREEGALNAKWALPPSVQAASSMQSCETLDFEQMQ